MGASLSSLSPYEKAFLGIHVATPPPGVTPNTHSLQALSYVILSICASVSLIALAVRLFVRLVLAKSLRLEDYCISIGVLAQVASIVTGILSNTCGIGKHTWDLTISDFARGSYWIYYLGMAYGISVCFIKLAILFQFLTIFVPDRRMNFWFWITCWVTIVTNLIFYTIFLFMQIFICTPREKLWNPFIQGGHCLNLIKLFESAAVFGVVSDFILLALPLRGILGLSMHMKTKLKYMGLFSLGLAACVISVVRTPLLWKAYGDSPDKSWNINIILFVAQIEITLGVLVFCLPATPQFFLFINEKTRSSRAYRSQRISGRASDEEMQVPHVRTRDQRYDARKRDSIPMVSLATFEEHEQDPPSTPGSLESSESKKDNSSSIRRW